MKKIYFTVGPSQTNKNFGKHLTSAVKHDIASTSHRSEQFHELYRDVDTKLKEIWHIPKNYKILLFSSATEIWDRLAQNCVDRESIHFVTGAFGKKHAESIESYGKRSLLVSEEYITEDVVRKYLSKRNRPYEYIAFTHNESSTGVKTPENIIHLAKKLSPESLIVVDAVSSVPLPKFDFKMIDGAYFSVQKCFGLPAGLGVLVASPKLVGVALRRAARGAQTGSYHSISKMIKARDKWETVETPNVLAIYLLSRVLADLQKTGIQLVRKNIKENARKIYRHFDKHKFIKPAVKNSRFRSDTVIVLDTRDRTQEIKKLFAKNAIILG